MTYEEFRNKVKNVTSKRNYKITGSYGVYDSYKYIRSHKWLDIGRPLTEKEFYSIIRTINKYLAKELLKGKDIKFPCKMGRLEIRKYPVSYRMKNNKLVTNLPVDWDKTLKLWYEDEEAYKNKTLIKMEEKELFKIFYNKRIANYNNKTFFEFSPNRELSVALRKKIKNGEIDAYALNGFAYVE
jgi:hypothetical protein